MSSIMVLSDNMIDKIAAGEVVERPASVVKELVENSIDAGATMITVEIKDGGIGLIRISDNGIGIDENEVISAFMRHATSKIRDIDDLDNVLTLGFRGEALSSIAAVSQMEMVTKPSHQPHAYRVEFNGGKLTSQSAIGGTDGTTIIIRNLFYNVPARRKFLKKPGIEASKITEVINRLVLGNPGISFRYIVNNSESLFTNGNGDLKSVIFSVYGKEAAKNLISVDYSKNGVTLTGFVIKPSVYRNNRNYENVYINGRYIKSTIIERAVENAYKTKIIIGKFPIYALNLHITPGSVDVNVHPQKLEVRFENEDLIYDIVFTAVNESLKGEDLIPADIINPFIKDKYEIVDKSVEITSEQSPEYKSDKANYQNENTEYQKKTSENINDKSKVLSSLFSKSYNKNERDSISEARKDYFTDTSDKIELISPALTGISKIQALFNNHRIIGQFFNTYWLVEAGSEIFIIDQHAAHERVIFESLMESYKNSDVVSQRLLEPVVLNLDSGLKIVLENHLALMESFGFMIDSLDDKYVLTGIPFVMRGITTWSFFNELLDKLSDIPRQVTGLYEEKLEQIAVIACKAAVKGNERLDFAEAKSLIEQILKLENPFTCPHGRPTVIRMSKYEIEKMFKRVQ